MSLIPYPQDQGSHPYLFVTVIVLQILLLTFPTTNCPSKCFAVQQFKGYRHTWEINRHFSGDKFCKINFLSKLHFKLILARAKTGGKNGIINFLSKENKSAKHFCSDVDNVVVAQWAKRLLPTPEDMGSSPEMSIFIAFL